jgi:hypothetical protein
VVADVFYQPRLYLLDVLGGTIRELDTLTSVDANLKAETKH